MKYLHFMKQDKNWFYSFDTSDKDKTFTPPTSNSSNGWIKFADSGSKAKALTYLKEKFPNDKPIFTEAYESDFTHKDKRRLEERRYKQRLQKEEDNA